MSKMDRQLNSKKDKETIYEIYRACRLCGAGAGYKMPIIQNVVDVDDTEVELKQKVRECVQIEVHQDDKMPPLICELCVDKVNDFYEFLEMCRQTNKRTRLRLGLPPQSMPRGAPDAGECILGLTEPVYVNDSDGEPLSKQKKMNPKVKVKREPELKVRLENRPLIESRTTRLSRRSPTPPRVTRHRTSSKEDNMSLNRLKDKPKSSPKPAPKSILKKEAKNEDNSLLTPRLKRSRDKEPVKLDTSNKKVKIAPKPSPASSKPSPASSKPSPASAKPSPASSKPSPASSKPSPASSKPSSASSKPSSASSKPSPASSKPSPATLKPSPTTSPRSTRPLKPLKASPKRAPSPPRLHKCTVCGQASKSPQANYSHMKGAHTAGFTSLKVACNPCSQWFATPEEAATHHKHHRNRSNPYECRRCYAEFKHLSAYDDHLDTDQCIPLYEVPDVKCQECWHLFPTTKLLDDHKCLGEEHRPGGKCGKCNRNYALLKNLKKHEQTCTAKKKGELIVNPELLSKVKPIQIRMSRCDPLLTNLKQEHYDVSNVTADFGLDKNCEYPYISSYSRLRIKSDPDGMVDINAEIKDEFYTEDYVHWDSEDSESDREESCSSPSIVLNPSKKRKVESLTNLSLKTIFSKRGLGKVPRKKRRVKREKMFDSLLAGTEEDVTRDINNIIDNLGDDEDEFDGGSQNGGDDSQKGDESQKGDDESQNDELNDTEKSMNVSEDKVDNKAVVSEKDDSLEKTEQNTAQKDDKLSEKNDQKMSENEVDKDSSKDFNSVSNDSNGSNNNLSSNNVNNKRVDDKVNNGINSLSFDYFDGEVVSKNENDEKSEESKIDYDNSQDSNSIGGVSESLLNDNTQSDVSENETIDKVTNDVDNPTSLPENSDIDDKKSQSNELSVGNLSQDSKMSELEAKTNDSSQVSDVQGDQSQVNDDQVQKNDNVTETDYNNAISVIVNCGKSKATDSEEMDDSKLMDALNAQIGSSNENSRDQTGSRSQVNENSSDQSSKSQVNENFNQKIALDEITAKSSDTDGYKDFNFDA